MIVFQNSARFDKPASVILLAEEHVKKEKYDFHNESLKGQIISFSRSKIFSGFEGEIFSFVIDGKIMVLCGIGPLNRASSSAMRILVRKAIGLSVLKKVKTVEIIPAKEQEGLVEAVCEAVMIGGYAWNKYRSKTGQRDDACEILKKRFVVIGSRRREYDALIQTASGVNMARDLVNENADVANSAFLEKSIRQLVKGHKEASLEVLDAQELKRKGMNLHLAVNRGSQKEAKLVIVRYNGAASKDDFTALVGKGVTFDTGGLNLKPTGYMETMKMDMSGAAAVIGVLHNVLRMKIRKNVLFAVGLAENAIDAASYKPGDVIRAYNGKTVEVGNTDAEGRLVLADVLAYIVRNYKPKRVIDIATLTGACIVALGFDYSGLMSNREDLARQLLESAERTDDRAWQLPIYPELTQHIKSKIADLKNIGLPKSVAGTCSAGEFLRQFVDDTPWAHMDIAGTAYVNSDSRLYFGFGATGAGVRLLTDFLLRKA